VEERACNCLLHDGLSAPGAEDGRFGLKLPGQAWVTELNYQSIAAPGCIESTVQRVFRYGGISRAPFPGADVAEECDHSRSGIG
jgi:hypothetical protein